MDVAVMQAVRLKGMVTPEAVAAATGRGADDVTAALTQLAIDENVQERNGRYRVTREGRDRLDAALAQERTAVDAAALAALYEEFTPLNSEFKGLAHEWQMRDDEPNDHSDAAHDGAVLAKFDDMASRFAPLVERIVAVTPPRLQAYPARFEAALAKVRAGESEWFLKPMIDSYHTVWFELHEELIGLAGLTRLQEAAEGRAD